MRLVHVDVDGDDGCAVPQHADENRVEFDAVLAQQQHAVVRVNSDLGEIDRQVVADCAKLPEGQPFVLIYAVDVDRIRPLVGVPGDDIVKGYDRRHRA